MPSKVVTNCGIDIEILLNLKPYERFEFIRKHLIKSLMKAGEKHQHLSISEVKKYVKLKPDKFSQMRQGYRDDNISMAKLAECVNENLVVLVTKTGYEEEAEIEKTNEALERIKSLKKPKPKPKPKPSGNKPYKFVNHTSDHLSMEVTGNEVHIYFNDDAPTSAKIVLLAAQTVKVGKLEKERIFPEEVKL